MASSTGIVFDTPRGLLSPVLYMLYAFPEKGPDVFIFHPVKNFLTVSMGLYKPGLPQASQVV